VTVEGLLAGRVAQRKRALARDRELVTLRDEGCDIGGIAERFGVTTRSASTLVYRARRRLRSESEQAS
jgi:DNA-directed RNA polymerase specialized sigma24 family protein